jgi:hypothetical protein
VPVQEVREALRAAFTPWGMPGLLRIDNGYPWGSAGDLPTDLALWLLGLGIDLWWNRPRRPQDNGVVERSQGTGKRWGESPTCPNPPEFQKRLDELDRLQRERYAYKKQKSRSEWHPDLRHSGRAYTADWEQQNWNWERMATHLSGYCVERHVDQKGQISIYNRNHYVGVPHRNKTVWVMFDAETCQWAVANEHGQILKEIKAEEVRSPRVRALEVTHRRGTHQVTTPGGATGPSGAAKRCRNFAAKLPVG